jgi:hypothetical protein
MAMFSYVCKYAKSIVEPFLYYRIEFSPIQPHRFSYAQLVKLLGMLTRGGVGEKLLEYTRHIKIGAGWELDQVILLDSPDANKPERRFSPLEVIMGGDIEWPVQKHNEFLEREEVRGEDGGVQDVYDAMNLLLKKATNTETLIWGSPIPIKSRMKEPLFALPSLNLVELNLLQPGKLWTRNYKEGNRLGLMNATYYRPNISSLRRCPLATLSLKNIPTTDDEWWKHLYRLIRNVAGTLRHLCLEMASPGLPLLSWGLDPQVDPYRLRLESLRVRGMILSKQTIAVLDPTKLRSVSLIGCSPTFEFGFPDAYIKSIRTFVTDTWAFIGTALAVTQGGGREVIFTPPKAGPAKEKGTLLGLVVTAMQLETLHLSAPCSLSTPVLKEFLSWENRVVELELALARGQWDVFIERLHCLSKLRRLNLHIDNEGKELKMGNRKRLPVDDAEEVAHATAKGGLVELEIGGIRWGVDWKQESPKLYRLGSSSSISPTALRYGASSIGFNSFKVIVVGRSE